MTQHEDDEGLHRPLIGFAVVLAIAVVSLFLIRHLRHEGALQDCLIAGHRNCEEIVTQ